MPEIKNRFAEHLAIKERRDGRSYSRKEIEEIVKISRTSIDNMMNNQTQRYDMKVVAKVCQWLGIDVTQFFVQEDDESKQLGALLPATA